MDVIVVGGGASGLVAAWRGACRGHKVRLLEGNPRLGVKLLLSGGGKCNLTHEGSVRELLSAFPPDQARFLRPALHAFGSGDVRELFRRQGVETYVRENGRVFPKDPGSALQVLEALESLVRHSGAEIRTGARVAALEGQAPTLKQVVLASGELLRADLFILATGGASYPETGTRGEALGWLKSLGVGGRSWFPALAPIPLMVARPEWEGVPLREGSLVLREGDGGKRLATFAGDVLFTRKGITGPAALELSEAVETARRRGRPWLGYLLGRGDEAALEAELLELQRVNPHLSLGNWVKRRLPERLVAKVCGQAGVDPDTRFKGLTRPERRALVSLLCEFPLGEPGPVALERGEVCAGGVGLERIDPRNLLVRGWDNLKVCGELLDLNGPVGGYNLQAAFSTGYLAGDIS
ncbi:NAD(P)/FAD-dependent oxidoreductase [Holophaga foetida]|uniref:NAD(P)/FAD-dependent oxidoreductase n=1 Tax=Holophaga foetida TaxID=35839 RepID=UPI0002471777|nr:aminoacetone oxidase family FAD-binding enzyme [Holophaga foetida]